MPPEHVSQVAASQWLSPAKVGYACSAHYHDHIDAINLTAEQQALLKDIPDAMFREAWPASMDCRAWPVLSLTKGSQ